MKEKDFEKTTILIPIYNESIYKYHKCSACNGEIYLEESFLTPFYFKENIKYCPFCGNEIIRYAEPQFEKEINWEWMDKFRKILNDTDKRLEYELFVNMSEKERNEIIEKARLGEAHFGFPISWNCNSSLCKIVKEIANRELHYSYLNQLKNGEKK